MPKVILMMLLAAVSSSAAAEWAEISKSSDETYTISVDPYSFIRGDNSTKMWSLNDYKTATKTPDGTPYMSEKMQFEYECKEKKLRLLYATLYSGNMGRGEVLFKITKPSEWISLLPYNPNGIREMLWTIACGKPEGSL